MKLRNFRIGYLFLYIILVALGIFGIVYTLVCNQNGYFNSTEMLMVNILSYCVGIIFNAFQGYMVIKSFRYGTLLLNQICFNVNKKRRKLTLVIFLSLFIISLSLSIVFTICRINGNNDLYLTYDFLIYYSLIILFNMIVGLSYNLFLRFDDQTSFK